MLVQSSRLSSLLSGSSLLYFLAFLSSFLLFYTYGRKYLRILKLSAKIAGPDFISSVKFVLGTFIAEPHDFYRNTIEIIRRYKDLAKMWIGPKLVIFLYNPADIELILSSNVHIDKSTEYDFFKPWFGNGLLISTGPKWKHHRKMIAPAFHQSVLKTFVSNFYENSVKVCNKMNLENGRTFDCHNYMSGTTVDILLETAMGYNVPRSEETGFNYAVAVMRMCDIIHRRHYKLWLRPNLFFQRTKFALEQSKLLKVITELTTKVVQHKKRDILKQGVDRFENINPRFDKFDTNYVKLSDKAKTNSAYNYDTAVRDDLDDNDENDVGLKKRVAFLEQLIENAHRDDVDFSEQEVLDQVNTLMFEGHDTTAAGSSFALCVLGIHKDIQKKVFEEVDDIFKKSDRPCTFDDTLEMHYLERVIMETLRMYPPVPAIARQLREEVKLASGDYTLPVGTTVIIAQALLHRSADVFPNPDIFNPDNFLPEKCQGRHFYSYIPFSAGPRSCVGRKFAMLKLKVILSTILRIYRIHCDMTEKEFKLQADIILKLSGGFNIRLEHRENIFAP